MERAAVIPNMPQVLCVAPKQITYQTGITRTYRKKQIKHHQELSNRESYCIMNIIIYCNTCVCEVAVFILLSERGVKSLIPSLICEVRSCSQDIKLLRDQTVLMFSTNSQN